MFTEPEYDQLPAPNQVYQSHMNRLYTALFNSVRDRVLLAPRPVGSDARISIMFSGGLDCTILAALCHLILTSDEPIDLLNVAFENPRSIRVNSIPASQTYSVPDRQTAHQTLDELSSRFGERQWRLVEINVEFQEYERMKPVIASLMAPCDTVMDMSIAAAFYFASRGNGLVLGDEYRSAARVVLSGLGADELLAGYGHHQKSFLQGGSTMLLDQLKLDLSRLPYRNLGRDDRLVSAHGKELRVPFLEEVVVDVCSRMPLWVKCDLRADVPKGVGEKMVLRMIAKWMLGMDVVAREKKRAVQFGARTAKLQDGREKGEDRIDLVELVKSMSERVGL
jgi:asparagine synthetase B (glutamine-hydrolysing)